MKVFIGADHGGFPLKEFLKERLGKEHEIVDLGCSSGESCDYPDFGKKVAEAVAESNRKQEKAEESSQGQIAGRAAESREKAFGILCCGTGIGMSLAANKVKGIRAAVVYDEFTARMAREHNNANVMCIGGRCTGKETALKLAEIFLGTGFDGFLEGGKRHQRRVEKITGIEKEYFK